MFYSQKNLFRALQLHILLIILWVNYMQEYQGKVLSLKTAWWWQGKTCRPLSDTWRTHLPSVLTGTWVSICAKYSEGCVFKHFTVNMAWYSSEDIFLLISPWIPQNYKVQCWNCKISFAGFHCSFTAPRFPGCCEWKVPLLWMRGPAWKKRWEEEIRSITWRKQTSSVCLFVCLFSTLLNKRNAKPDKKKS